MLNKENKLPIYFVEKYYNRIDLIQINYNHDNHSFQNQILNVNQNALDFITPQNIDQKIKTILTFM
jgi:hypothetical protein